jgi:hypothetical protein
MSELKRLLSPRQVSEMDGVGVTSQPDRGGKNG